MNKYLDYYLNKFGVLDTLGLELLFEEDVGIFFQLLIELEKNNKIRPFLFGFSIELLGTCENKEYCDFIRKQLNNKNRYIRESATIAIKMMED